MFACLFENLCIFASFFCGNCAAVVLEHEALCSSWIRKCEKLLNVIPDLCNGSRYLA